MFLYGFTHHGIKPVLLQAVYCIHGSDALRPFTRRLQAYCCTWGVMSTFQAGDVTPAL